MSTIGEAEIVNSLVSEVLTLYTQIGSRYSTYEVEGAAILREIKSASKNLSSIILIFFGGGKGPIHSF